MTRWTIAAIVSGLAALASGAAILMLPLRSVDVRRAEIADVERAPQGGVFRIGGVVWDLHTYQTDPHLEPFRAFLAQHCPGQVGLGAAVCLSDLFAAKFPHGPPQNESFSRSYDPIQDLDAHMRGEPGYCVTRSALISTILLSAGIPARQVQYIGRQGHTVMEVFDGARWSFFDPMFGMIYRGPEGALPATAAFLGAEGAAAQVARSPAGVPLDYDRNGDHVTLRYPEPWQYTRVGPRFAAWPMRTRSEDVGAWRFSTGAGQPIARAGFLFFSAAAAISALMRLRRAARREELASAPALAGEDASPSAEAA